jgi:hypothetical protein
MVVEGIERRFDVAQPTRCVSRRELPQPSRVGGTSGEIGDRRDSELLLF